MSIIRGEIKVEFYTHKNEIKEEYDNGQVVLKILYEKLKKKYNWKMSYRSFCIYAKREIINKKEIPVSLPKNNNLNLEEVKTKKENNIAPVEIIEETNVADEIDEETKKEMARVLESLKHLFPTNI